MNDLFDRDGCLTDLALHELLEGNPEELTRLEIAEHLSFCDRCTDRYVGLLEASPLLIPLRPLREQVLRRVLRQARAVFWNRYVAAGMAACFTMTLWFSGAFELHTERLDGAGFETAYAISESFTGKTRELSGKFLNGFQSLLTQLSELDLKGVLHNENK